MLQSGPSYDVIIKYDGDNSLIFIKEGADCILVTKESDNTWYVVLHYFRKAWYLLYPISFVDKDYMLGQFESCRQITEGGQSLMRYDMKYGCDETSLFIDNETNMLERTCTYNGTWHEVHLINYIGYF